MKNLLFVLLAVCSVGLMDAGCGCGSRPSSPRPQPRAQAPVVVEPVKQDVKKLAEEKVPASAMQVSEEEELEEQEAEVEAEA